MSLAIQLVQNELIRPWQSRAPFLAANDRLRQLVSGAVTVIEPNEPSSRAWNQESAESGIEQFREIFCAISLAPRVKGDGKALECRCDSNMCRNQRFLIRVAPS